MTVVPVDEVAVGDLVLVGPGEVLPVDGLVEGGPAVLDESALTGEPELAEHAAGDRVRSGTLNAGGAFEVRCPLPAAQSTYAGTVVARARSQGLALSLPDDVTEEPGRGVAATVDGQRVRVGKRDRAPEATWARTAVSRAGPDGCALVWVEVDGAPVGAVLLKDPLRPDAGRTLRRLRSAGIDRLVMLTGDRPEPAREVGAVLGLDEVRAQQSPESKVAAARAEQQRGVTVMVGDGLNDAPALVAATVGVAMGAGGATAASEAADVVLTTDRLDRVADAMEIARYARRIAVQP